MTKEVFACEESRNNSIKLISAKIQKQIKNRSDFEISGNITSIGGNQFEVNNQAVTIDPSQLESFKQKGILEVGAKVKVEGQIIDNVKYAQEIKVIGTGQGQYKFECNCSSDDEDGNEVTPTPEVTIMPSPTPLYTVMPTTTPLPTVNPSQTPTVSPSPTPEASLSAMLGQNIIGTFNMRRNQPNEGSVITLINQIIKYLKNLVD